jgi:hypothetical protein
LWPAGHRGKQRIGTLKPAPASTLVSKDRCDLANCRDGFSKFDVSKISYESSDRRRDGKWRKLGRLS